jgi:hypothetical protein
LVSERGIHDTVVKFRANAALVASVNHRARRNGMTMAEYLRAVVRRDVGDAA